MEDAVGHAAPDELLDRARVGKLAVEKAHAAFARLVGLTGAGRVPALDRIEHAARSERLEVLHPRAPPVRAEHGDVGVLGEDVFSEVAAGKARDPGDQDAHRPQSLAITVPGLAWLS